MENKEEIKLPVVYKGDGCPKCEKSLGDIFADSFVQCSCGIKYLYKNREKKVKA